MKAIITVPEISRVKSDFREDTIYAAFDIVNIML